MRAAKARGLSIVIVSDMYLTEARLRRLLTACAGADVLAMVDHIFMSCEHGMGKANGLFGPVLKALKVRPDQVLHVGDNVVADLAGAAAAGIHAVHLKQFDDETANRLRLESVAGVMVDPAVRVTVPALQPHRAAVALRQEADPAHVLGHDVMGPVMHAFAEFVHADVQAMAERLGKPVRPLFLMRDGHLPHIVYSALYPDDGAVRVNLTRFVSIGSTLADEAGLDAFVDEYLNRITPQAFVRNLMLKPDEYASALRNRSEIEAGKALLKLVRQPNIRRRILARGAAYRERVLAHLRRAGVQDGDAVMFVDVGYNGSVQNVIAPVLEQAMGLTVAGRYLFLRERHISRLDKRGLLGVDLVETRAMQALATCVAVVEQLCNLEEGSTIDFEADGTPIREPYALNAAQHAIREAVQAGCVAFARDARAGMHHRPLSDDLTARRRMAAASLARLLFLPMPSEVTLFEAFEHDDNQGTSEVQRLLDREHAEAGLRRRGLAYVNEARRMYVPAEVAHQGFALNLTLMAASRFGLDVRNSDFQAGGVDVPVMLLDAVEQTIVPITAYPTHAGWYRISVPVPRAGVTAAIQVGGLWSSVQIDEASWTSARLHDLDFDPATMTATTADRRPATTMTDAMHEVSPGIFVCDSTAVVIAAPPGSDAQVLELIFRPLAPRDAAAEAAGRIAA
ncbi:MAG: hydrolase [Sphingomonas taxi]